MTTSKIQPSFAAGELSPSFWSRVDLAIYQIGLKICKNFLVHLSGGVSRRTGTQFIANAKFDDKKVKLVPFEVSKTDSYLIEFGNYYCRFYKNKAQLENLGSPYEIVSPYSESDVENIKFVQSADVLFITHPNHPPYELARYGDINWTLTTFDYEIPPFMLSNQNSTHKLNVSALFGATVNLTSSLSFFESGHVGSYFKIYHDIDGQAINLSISGVTNSSYIYCKGNWRFKTIGTTCALTVRVEKSYNFGSTWSVIKTYILVNDEINDFGVEDDFCVIRINVSAYTSGSINAMLTSDPFSHAGIIKINSVTNPLLAIGTVITSFASTNLSDDWAESSWSTLKGFPTCLSFYQERLCFASTFTQPQTIWMSRTGNYYNFDVNDNLLDTDRISIDLISRKVNTINDLILLNNIIGLTTASEWQIGAADGGSITPTNVSANIQGHRGASKITPVTVGNKIIYIQPSGSIIRDLGYDYNSNTFTGNNLSVLSQHLFEGYTIIDIDYQQEPDSIIWMTRSDGILISMTYLKEQEVLAFARHETDGIFENVAVVNTEIGDEVWVSVLRDSKRFIEVFEKRYTDETDQWYLDNALKYDGVATDTITGLDHLDGKTVYVLGDGNVIKTLNDEAQTPLVVTAGELTLPYEVEKAIIGLPFTSEFETLPIDLSLQSGTLQDKKIRAAQATFIFENSRGGKYGDRDVENYDEVIDERLFMDLPIDLFSGRKKLVLNSSWGIGKTLFFKQEDPLPTTILAVIPKITIGG